MIGSLARQLLGVQLGGLTNKDAVARRIIFDTLKERGGVYVKGLQVLAVTQKFLEGWAGPSEMQVFDQIEPEAVEVAKYVNFADFVWISEEPVATGSFAVVHKGKLRENGMEVAIKILRPSVERHLRADLRKLKTTIKLSERFLPSTILDYSAVIDEFSRTCVLETDYVREVTNMKYFQKFYAGHPYVKIPVVLDELCRKNVIVQEWIEGETYAGVLAGRTAEKPATRLALEKTGSNLWTQMTVAGGEALRMAMCADFVFGDPHPGNIKLLPDNKIAFIDFGIVANRPSSRMAFYKWVKTYRDVLANGSSIDKLADASIMCFCPDLSMALKECNLGGQSAMDRILEGVREKLAVTIADNGMAKELFANGHMFRLFTDILDGNNALGLKLNMVNFQLLKAMQAYLGSVTVLDNSETRDRFAGCMLGAMNYALAYADQVGVENDMPLMSHYSRSESTEILVDTMASLANDNEFLFDYLCGRI